MADRRLRGDIKLSDASSDGVAHALGLAIEAVTEAGWRVVDTCAFPTTGRRGAPESFIHAIRRAA